jgi:single-stranded-DNA-specific exonuclease
MDLARSAVPAFRSAFDGAARRRLLPAQLRPTLRPDCELSLLDVDLQLVHWMQYLGPHGIGNPGPLFLAREVGVDGPRVVGDRHLKARLLEGRSGLDAIGFGFGERHPPESLGAGAHDALFRLERNEWRGRVTPQARLVDLRPSAGP